MARERTFAAWAAILLICLDIAGEVVRIGACVLRPQEMTTAVCSDPIGPVTRLVHQLVRAMAPAEQPATPPVAPPPVVPAIPGDASPMERLRQAPGL